MRFTLLVATAFALIGGTPLARADMIAVTSLSGGADFPSFNGTDQTIGFTFSSTVAISVTKLGFLDKTPANDLGQSHQVGIWDSSGDLLASTTVLTNDPLTGSFRYDAITPISLAPNVVYTIGAAITSPFSDLYNIPASFTTSPDITLLGSARNDSSGGFSDPTTVTAGNGRIGPDFQFVDDSVAVPEPLSLSVLGSGVLGVAMVRRRRS